MNDASAEEGAGVEFTITLSQSVSEAMNLTWTTADGTAVSPGSDYTATTTGMVSFPANSSSPEPQRGTFD